MQPAPDNKGFKPRQRRNGPSPQPEGGYLMRCGCKKLVTVPFDGSKVHCQVCGAPWRWEPAAQAAILGRRSP